MVNALVVLALTVVDPPNETKLPLIVIDELVNELLPIFDNVLVEPLIETPAKVLNVPPNDKELDPIVTELFAS